MDMNEIKEIFFQECEEQLAELESGLLKMNDGDRDPETVNAVFRAVVLCDGDELRPQDFPQISGQMADVMMMPAMPAARASATAAGTVSRTGSSKAMRPRKDMRKPVGSSGSGSSRHGAAATASSAQMIAIYRSEISPQLARSLFFS